MPVAAVDLFCGVGGLTHGLELAGVPVVVGVDVENSCKFAYEHNNRARFVLRDVTQLASDELENYFPEGTTKVLVPHVNRFPHIRLDTIKTVRRMINGGCYTTLPI